MTDQEIINAIDAEIAETEVASKAGPEEFYFECIAMIAGLRFARALIANRMEGSR